MDVAAVGSGAVIQHFSAISHYLTVSGTVTRIFAACFGISFAAAACGREANYEVVTASKTIQVPRSRWHAMPNPETFADNFEERRTGSKHRFGRVVTVFRIPMSDDRRLGVRISDAEYLELFVSHPGTITARVRVDKGSYWVMSRETFEVPQLTGVDTHTWHDLTTSKRRSLVSHSNPKLTPPGPCSSRASDRFPLLILYQEHAPRVVTALDAPITPRRSRA
jgi:hypothetical protein